MKWETCSFLYYPFDTKRHKIWGLLGFWETTNDTFACVVLSHFLDNPKVYLLCI